MKMLGYTPYHMVELVTEGGLPHMKIFQEAIHSQNKRLGIKRYEKADFERWMGNYDVSGPAHISPKSSSFS